MGCFSNVFLDPSLVDPACCFSYYPPPLGGTSGPNKPNLRHCMFLRKWVVRGLVALVLCSCLGAGVIYQQWTNPTAVRQQVVEMLEKQFPGATVTLDSARLRLLGGVVLTEL